MGAWAGLSITSFYVFPGVFGFAATDPVWQSAASKLILGGAYFMGRRSEKDRSEAQRQNDPDIIESRNHKLKLQILQDDLRKSEQEQIVKNDVIRDYRQ